MLFFELCQKYLAWVKLHQESRTYDWYNNYISMFLRHPDIAFKKPVDIKPYHVQEWIDSHESWGDNYKGGAVVAIKRVFNWAIDQGYIDVNPIQRLKRPSSQPRKHYMKPEDYAAVLYHLDEKDPFYDLVRFVWLTGCRPQEVRHIERRHVDLENERVIFPVRESKGKRSERAFYMQHEALDIVKYLTVKYPDGKLFRNSRGQPWTNYAICGRFNRLSKQIGRKLFCYAARHGFATDKLKKGYDHLTVAGQMGHRDGSMLGKVYSHVHEEADHLKKMLRD